MKCIICNHELSDLGSELYCTNCSRFYKKKYSCRSCNSPLTDNKKGFYCQRCNKHYSRKQKDLEKYIKLNEELTAKTIYYKKTAEQNPLYSSNSNDKEQIILCPDCHKQLVKRSNGSYYCKNCVRIFSSLDSITEQIKLSKNNIKSSSLSTPIASHLERNTQFQHYHHEANAHGYAAEDANALNDVLHFKKVEKTGLSNELNGPDRIVDGQGIQVKYYSSAKESVGAAFDKNGYRYPGQKLEVPSDQYDVAVEEMRKKISEGLVKDSKGNVIRDPNKAKDIVQKGNVSYEQAKNIAKAGNIDSLKFDVMNQAIMCSCVFGASFVISFAQGIWDGDNIDKALKKSITNALQSSLAAGIVGVISSQVLRFKAAAAGTVVARQGVKFVAQTEVGRQAITAIAQASLGKAVYGAAAINHVSKLLRSNVITSAIALGVTTAPDMYRAIISQNISWAQFSKNLAINTASVAGGAGGWFGGAAAGAAIGSWIPGIGTAIGGVVGGIAGALGGGYAAGKAAKGILDEFVEDDAKEMIRILEKEAQQSANNHLLTKDEVENKLVPAIKNTVSAEWLRDMYGSSSYDSGRARFARDMLDSECMNILKSRPYVKTPSEEILIENACIIINEWE